MDVAVTTPLERVLEVIPSVFDIMDLGVNKILENDILVIYFAVGMISMGLVVFRKLKKAAKK